MVERREEPEYIKRRREARRATEERQKHKERVSAIDRLTDQLKTEQSQEQTEDKGRALREIITIGLLIATVIVTGIGDVIFYRTMVDAHNNAEESGKLALESNKISQKAMEASTRAWVGTSVASLVGVPQPGQPLTINISAFNTGREPAFDFSYDASPKIIAGAETAIFDMDMESYVTKCFETPARQEAEVLYPSPGGFNRGGFDFKTTVPGDQITADVKSGKAMLVIQGCMTYITFEHTKHSTFCYVYKAGFSRPDRLNICRGGFRAD